MRLVLVFLLLMAGGCASGGGSIEALLSQPRIRTVTAGSVSAESSGGAPEVIRYIEDPVIIRQDIGRPVPEVWEQLLMAYADEGLIPDQLDQPTKVLAVSRFEISREFRGTPISLLLDCGLSTTGRQLAESARIQATIISQVSEVGSNASRVSTRFEGVAFPSDASGGRARDCYTTGELERTLAVRIRNALGETAPEEPAQIFHTPSPPVSTGRTETRRAESRTFPVEPGDRIRLHTSATVRYTGTFLVFRNDTVLMRRSRVTGVPFASVRTLEVQRTHAGRIWAGALVGMAAGVGIAVGTDLGISGRHQIQGKILNPGLGAVVGGLTGAFLASGLFGSKWEDVPLVIGAPPPAPGSMPGLGLRIRWPQTVNHR